MTTPNIAACHDPMGRMYEYLAFVAALDDGLSVDELVEETASQSRIHLDKMMNQFISQLNDQIEVNEREGEDLVEEARGLAPREAQVYTKQLSQNVKDLTPTVSKLEKEYDAALNTTRELTTQNAITAASVLKLKSTQKQQKGKYDHVVGELYAAGASGCQYIANPNQNRSGHDNSKYPRNLNPGGRFF